VVETIIGLAREGKADLNVVCHEWTPKGIGGDCLRANYTALDHSNLYHRDEIKAALLAAGAKRSRECPKPRRENPFVVRMKQDKGEYEDRGWEQSNHNERYADFTFADWGDDMKMDDEMKGVVKKIKEELMKESGGQVSSPEYAKVFKKMCLRWHPDKHPDDKKAFATRVFQWLQKFKSEKDWENRAWTA